jgi:hypothetical protein
MMGIEIVDSLEQLSSRGGVFFITIDCLCEIFTRYNNVTTADSAHGVPLVASQLHFLQPRTGALATTFSASFDEVMSEKKITYV